MADPAPTLAELQSRFQGYVLRGQAAITSHVAAEDADGGRKRLAIYAEGYALRLEDALRADFRGLHAMLGDDDFTAMTHGYLRAHPSTYRSIRWFGQHLPQYLATASPWREQPLATEMAAFDWAMSLALDAADAPALTIDHLAAVAPEAWPTLRFRLQPAISRLDLHWNVVQLRKAILDEQPPPEPQRSENAVAWLVWRGDYMARYRSLPAHEAWAIDMAGGGANFAELCEGLAPWVDPSDAPLEAATLLKRWVVDGLLVADPAEC